jgi:hypothetical protein
MEISRGSLVIAVTLSLSILCSCSAAQHAAAIIPPGTNVNPTGTNTIPAGPGVVHSGTKHFAGVP